MQDVLNALDMVVAGAEAPLRVLQEVYPLSTAALRSAVLPTPAPQAPLTGAFVKAAISPARSGRMLEAVFPADLTDREGARLLLEVARQMADDTVKFTILGRVDWALQDLVAAAPPNVELAGPQAPGRRDLSGYDISLHLSKWPHTYCSGLSEAWAAGLAPVVTDIGALAERVEDGVTGFKVPVDGAGELLRLLTELIDDCDRLQAVRRNVTPALWSNTAEHTAGLVALYEELLDKRPPSVRRLGGGTSRIDMEVLGFSVGSPRWDQPHHVRNGELPSASFPSLAPVSSGLLRATLRNLEHDRAETPAASCTLHGQIGTHLARSSSRRDGSDLQMKERPRVSGHVRSALSANFGPRVLALRAADDLILRRLEETALPTVLDDAGALDIRFVSEPLSLELLDDRPYSVEVATLASRRTEFTPLGFTLFGGAMPSFVGDAARPGSAAPRTAMPTRSAPAAVGADLCAIDELELVGLTSVAASFLSLRVGPAARTSAAGGALSLRLSGPRGFRSTLLAAGPGLSAAAALRSGVPMVAAVWLTGLHPGTYALSLEQEGANGAQLLPARAAVDADGRCVLTRD